MPLTILICLQATAIAQTGLPRIAVTLPASSVTPSTENTIPAACLTSATPLVISAGEFDPGQTASFAAPVSLNPTIQQLTATNEAWLLLHISGAQLTGHETQSDLDARVDGLLNTLPFNSPSLRGLIVRVDDAGPHADLTAYALMRLAIGAHAHKANLRLAITFSAGAMMLNHDLVKRIVPYVDLLGVSSGSDWHAEADWVAGEALNKPLLLQSNVTNQATESLLTDYISAAGSQVEFVWADSGSIEQASQTCTLSRSLATLIPAGQLPMDAKTLPVTLDSSDSASKALWISSGQSSQLYALVTTHAAGHQIVNLNLHWPQGKNYQIQWFNPMTGESLGATPTLNASIPFLLATLERKDDQSKSVYSQVEVKGNVSLSVEEIIARWQQYRAAQESRLENYQASNFVGLHFETVSIGSGFDISMRMKQFYRRGAPVEFAQTELYVNGVRFGKNHEFPLPQLEPEKVVTKPLELKLNERYNYTLLGTERIDGNLCFVVGVEPKTKSETLYRGKIWIDGESFREVRQSLSQSSDKTSIVANVETEDFALVDDGKGGKYNLPKSLTAQQTLNVAGRDFMLQRKVQFSDYIINSKDFDAAIQVEHASTDAMYRDTDQGLRELKKSVNERVLVEHAPTRIRSLMMGAIYMGAYSFPIPIAGISIADFDFRHTGAQFTLLFAGPFAVANLSRQQSPHARYAFDLAVSGIPDDNRVYNGNVEDTAAEIFEWSESFGARETWTPTPHFSLTGYTYFEYDIYSGTSSTSSAYIVPSSGPVLIPGVQLRLTDRGYIFTAEGMRAQRFIWNQFGYAGSTKPLESGYTLYNADLSKDYYFTKFTKGGIDLGYQGGDQLDRFSRYLPTFLSPHGIHGIAGNPIPVDALAVATANYGFNVMDVVKFGGAYSYAEARNLDQSSHFRNMQGLELNFNTLGPWGTLLQGSVSYALRDELGPLTSRWGFQIMLFKPLK